ncbi:MAG: hypothetical protein A2046_01145 [Bacteroidetes bacterium GWA2_30_7]|nr:MAG: hypothetical protein A2046_01145 [Bacteroidetes bacterium GWA2_30_7]
MKKTKGRVSIPQNPVSLLTLGDKVYKKHLAEGANSKLNLLEGFDLTKVGATIAPCLASHNLAEDYKQKMEAEYRKRDLLLPDIEETLRACKSLLKGIYIKNPKLLGEWGFSVDDTKKSTEIPESLDSPEIQ